MDAILNGKAVYRSSTVGAGSMISEIGSNVGGLAGLALNLIGVAVQGIGGAMAPEADMRSWQLLPSSFYVYTLKLPPGEHEFVFRQRVYFEKVNEVRKKVKIEGPKDLAAVFAPPTLTGVYSEVVESGTSASGTKKAVSAQDKGAVLAVVIPPPLGFQSIEKFPSILKDERPEAFAPDLKKIVRKIEKKLSGMKFTVEKISHQEIVSDMENLTKMFPLSFQIQLEGLNSESSGQDVIYSTKFKFSLVDTSTGQANIKESITGRYIKTSDDKTGTTDAFYKCLDDALDKFVSQTNISNFHGMQVKTSINRYLKDNLGLKMLIAER